MIKSLNLKQVQAFFPFAIIELRNFVKRFCDRKKKVLGMKRLWCQHREMLTFLKLNLRLTLIALNIVFSIRRHSTEYPWFRLLFLLIEDENIFKRSTASDITHWAFDAKETEILISLFALKSTVNNLCSTWDKKYIFHHSHVPYLYIFERRIFNSSRSFGWRKLRFDSHIYAFYHHAEN
jgi:hypothetical protein